MQHWQKTTFLWDFSPGTRTSLLTMNNVGRLGPQPHLINEITAESIRGQQGEIGIQIMEYRERIATEHERILAYLTDGVAAYQQTMGIGQITVQRPTKIPVIQYRIHFTLSRGAQFCDTALRLVREILHLFGVNDPNGAKLSNFQLFQQTYVLSGTEWIPYSRWLRKTHRLPIYTIMP